jgi:PAS domain S-box-containing protein
MDPITIHQIAETGAILTAASSLLLFLPRVRICFKKIWAKTLGRRGAQLDAIARELKPKNGEGSVRDQLGRIEVALRESDAFQKAALNLHDIPIVHTNAAGGVIGINRHYQRLFGYSISEVKDEGWINAIAQSERDQVMRAWKDAVASGREFHQDILFRKSDGTKFVGHASAYREIDIRGKVTGYLAAIVPEKGNTEQCPHMAMCSELGPEDALR